MALYCIGDVQGCRAAFDRLLAEIDFSPSRDRLIVLGDLVNRGPDSLGMLRRLMALGHAAQTLLGNHDLHLLGVAAGVRRAGRSDTLQDILAAPDRAALLDWLRQRPMALRQRGVLMVHAGVLPQWSAAQTLALAAEVESVLRAARDINDFLLEMYGDLPNQWHDGLRGTARLRVIVNALTRLRLCTADGRMDFERKGDPGGLDGRAAAAAGLMPWFDVPGRKTARGVVAFGHWSTLGKTDRPNLLALDTGCVWGGCLSAVRLGRSAREREWFQVHCTQAQIPTLTHNG
ncbi:MAG: symmetrical bis(5'-nucleosyl)-tetraphosphatase [Burkholderiaceae bacterium]|jgi:bis(5'-nucleosyl)-tetraphosphatase (symmetrical)|nr:symmetrical bis(5'-nucleosyl)-tetraphosphatase [Burkholderiaceae bacterium]